MADRDERAVTGAGKQTAENPDDELGTGEQLGTGEKHLGQEEHCPGQETAEQRTQRRLLRELALRALI